MRSIHVYFSSGNRLRPNQSRSKPYAGCARARVGRRRSIPPVIFQRTRVFVNERAQNIYGGGRSESSCKRLRAVYEYRDVRTCTVLNAQSKCAGLEWFIGFDRLMIAPNRQFVRISKVSRATDFNYV